MRGVQMSLVGLTVAALLAAGAAQAAEPAVSPGRDGDAADFEAAGASFTLGDAARLDAAINLRPAGRGDSAVQFRHGANVPTVLLHSGNSDAKLDALTGDGAFASGGALEGVFGDLGYSLDWQASLKGTSGSVSLRRGDAQLSFGTDTGGEVLSGGTGIAASWRPDMSLGGLEIQLSGEPMSQDLGGSVSWSFSW